MKDWLDSEERQWRKFLAMCRPMAGDYVPDWVIFIDWRVMIAVGAIRDDWGGRYGKMMARRYARAKAAGPPSVMGWCVRAVLLFLLGITPVILGASLLWVIFLHFPLMTMAALVGGGILARHLWTARHGGRALADQVGTWPKVTHAGNGGYLITATIRSPGRAKWPDNIAMGVAAVLFFIALGNLQTIWPGTRDNESLRIVGVLTASIIAGWSSRAIWKPLCWLRLKIEVQNGGAVWTGPKGQTCRIKPFEEYEPGAHQHRLAGEEARAFGARVRKGKDEDAPAYQVASEVVFKTGARKQIEWPVAEIMPDIGGTKAAMLAAALDIAIEVNRKTIEAEKAKQKAAAGGMGGGLDRE